MSTAPELSCSCLWKKWKNKAGAAVTFFFLQYMACSVSLNSNWIFQSKISIIFWHLSLLKRGEHWQRAITPDMNITPFPLPSPRQPPGACSRLRLTLDRLAPAIVLAHLCRLQPPSSLPRPTMLISPTRSWCPLIFQCSSSYPPEYFHMDTQCLTIEFALFLVPMLEKSKSKNYNWVSVHLDRWGWISTIIVPMVF